MSSQRAIRTRLLSGPSCGKKPLNGPVSCDMKLHWILPGWSHPGRALRVAAGSPGKHTSIARDGTPQEDDMTLLVVKLL
jgi:hypothetical protein